MAERDEFEAYDKIHGIRKAMVEALRKAFPDFNLTYSIGRQRRETKLVLTFVQL